MRNILRRIFYPPKITRTITLFYFFAILPVVVFSLLGSGIQAYGEQQVANINSRSVLEDRTSDEYGHNLDLFMRECAESAENMALIVGDLYQGSEFILSASVTVKRHHSYGQYVSNITFVASENARDQYFNYINLIPTTFTRVLDESGIYVSDGFLADNGLKIGDTVYIKNTGTEEFSYELKIIGSYSEYLEHRRDEFYFVFDDPSVIMFDTFSQGYRFYSLHTLTESIDYNYTVQLSGRMTYEIDTRAKLIFDSIGQFTNVLDVGEIFAVASSIAISLMMLYSILSRGKILSGIHKIQNVYYQIQKRVCLNFVIDNLINYLIAVSISLILALLIASIVKLVYGLSFFLNLLTVNTIIINGLLVIIVSLISFYLNHRSRDK